LSEWLGLSAERSVVSVALSTCSLHSSKPLASPCPVRRFLAPFIDRSPSLPSSTSSRQRVHQRTAQDTSRLPPLYLPALFHPPIAFSPVSRFHPAGSSSSFLLPPLASRNPTSSSTSPSEHSKAMYSAPQQASSFYLANERPAPPQSGFAPPPPPGPSRYVNRRLFDPQRRLSDPLPLRRSSNDVSLFAPPSAPPLLGESHRKISDEQPASSSSTVSAILLSNSVTDVQHALLDLGATFQNCALFPLSTFFPSPRSF
jgi:hypothetical protein